MFRLIRIVRQTVLSLEEERKGRVADGAIAEKRRARLEEGQSEVKWRIDLAVLAGGAAY